SATLESESYSDGGYTYGPYYYGKVGVKTLYVNKHGSYLYIYLYRSDKKNGEYSYVSSTTVYNDSNSDAPKKSKYTSKKVYYINDEYAMPGQTYYYRTVAVNANGKGIVGDAKKVTYPAE
ncbi:MAG: hypothetical protein J6Q41_04325, partial [Firmicutes bacterium]|nr:hypothetical protein [Bacillota bacterium]